MYVIPHLSQGRRNGSWSFRELCSDYRSLVLQARVTPTVCTRCTKDNTYREQRSYLGHGGSTARYRGTSHSIGALVMAQATCPDDQTWTMIGGEVDIQQQEHDGNGDTHDEEEDEQATRTSGCIKAFWVEGQSVRVRRMLARIRRPWWVIWGKTTTLGSESHVVLSRAQGRVEQSHLGRCVVFRLGGHGYSALGGQWWEGTWC